MEQVELVESLEERRLFQSRLARLLAAMLNTAGGTLYIGKDLKHVREAFSLLFPGVHIVSPSA